jgi:spectinomycin phosphotransferase
MKFEPELDKPALMETIRRVYDFAVTSLRFIPEGMVGWHYHADRVDGKCLFVTVLPDKHVARLQARRLDFTLAVITSLYERGLFIAQPAVYRTLDGKLKADFQGQPLIIYEYIDGANLGEAWPYPPEVLTGLGRLTAQLHQATADIGMEVPYVEQFHLPFEETLLACLKELEQVPEDARPGILELCECILPRREELLGLLARTNELGEIAKALNPPLVLVHTDMTPHNILRSRQGKLFIVDWEGIMLAPAEHDLFIFAGEGFATILAEYIRSAGKPRLYPELFAYYFHRRNLEDITEFIICILQENTNAKEDRYELDLLISDCLSGWPFLKTSQEWAAQQIRNATT